MSDEVFSTTLAYTKSPRATKRTSFQDELIKAITARSARQRSSEYSDDFESDEIVSLGEFSDTSVDENSVKKKMNDFHLSDDEVKNSSKRSFLKIQKSTSDIIKDELVSSIKNDEAEADGCEDTVINSLPEPQNQDQENETETMKVKPKPRTLPIKSISSEANNLDADAHFKPLPRPRSMLKKNSPREEKEQGEEKEIILSEELDSQHTPCSIPSLNGTLLDSEKIVPEGLDPEGPSPTSPSSSDFKESFGDSFSPGSGEKTTSTDQNEEVTENHNTLKSKENEEDSFLTDFILTAIEKPTQNQETTDALEGEGQNAELTVHDDLTSLLIKSQSVLITTNATESAKKPVEDRNMKNKKTTNNRASSASGSEDWLEKKNTHLHEMNRIKRIESENLRIQNEQKRTTKREEASASFEAWKAMKEKEAKKTAVRKRLEEKNKKKMEQENAVRKEEALQAFEKWKEKKIEYLREKNRKEKEYERAKKQKEEEAVAEKRKDNIAAVEKWNERKEAFFKQKEKEKINEKKKEELKKAEKKDKDKQALDEYDRWLEKKERQEKIERRQKKHHSFLGNETLPPWSPANRTMF
ncbi:PREDICTED: microtubule-associated protein 9 [Elephantulus edwardii]|uniref:microtubule-associated protein 9 n=1 Tax=Elephantulus edwardii TaxID=28737 RepID=UPI0003F0AF9F|nr:PREDICTED: microtubule-associated protein 9 [Elephantulus edwardii]